MVKKQTNKRGLQHGKAEEQTNHCPDPLIFIPCVCVLCTHC